MSKNKQQIVLPISLETPRDLSFGCLHPPVTQLGQLIRIALPVQNRLHEAWPVTPLKSLSTFASCRFISVNTFCMRWVRRPALWISFEIRFTWNKAVRLH